MLLQSHFFSLNQHPLFALRFPRWGAGFMLTYLPACGGLFALASSLVTAASIVMQVASLTSLPLRALRFHYVRFSNLHSTGWLCCTRLRLSSGLRVVMLFACLYFLPFRGRLRGGRKNHASPSSAFYKPTSHAWPSNMVRSRFSHHGRDQFSLLTPYLLLAVSLHDSAHSNTIVVCVFLEGFPACRSASAVRDSL